MNTLRIGYLDYAVGPFTVNELQSRGTAWGRIVTDPPQVFVEASLSPREQARVLIHEVIHACFTAAAENQAEDAYTEEQVCGLLDRQLTATFLANPHLSAVLHQAIHHGQPIVAGG